MGRGSGGSFPQERCVLDRIEIRTDGPTELAFMEHDPMIEALAPNGPITHSRDGTSAVGSAAAWSEECDDGHGPIPETPNGHENGRRARCRGRPRPAARGGSPMCTRSETAAGRSALYLLALVSPMSMPSLS